jgi:hypothetical protein
MLKDGIQRPDTKPPVSSCRPPSIASSCQSLYTNTVQNRAQKMSLRDSFKTVRNTHQNMKPLSP